MRETASATHYVGRFAPSPTGPLHFGSLVTALTGFLRARELQGEWLVRIDDIDPPRKVPGAAAGILRTLARCALRWDREVTCQSTRLAAYRQACEHLLAARRAYYCVCSRRQIGSGPYPGTCRDRCHRPAQRHCVRIRVPDDPIVIDDVVQGRSVWHLAAAGGDFVIWRVEDLPAYHLAAVLDDAAAGVTEVVRGADLLDSAPRQRYLQSLLGLAPPAYLHIPAATDARGRKLSKQNLAPPIDDYSPGDVLTAGLAWLGQAPPATLRTAPPAQILAWAADHWRLSRVPRGLTRAAPALGL